MQIRCKLAGKNETYYFTLVTPDETELMKY